MEIQDTDSRPILEGAAQVASLEAGLVVGEVYPGSLAEAIELKAGDRIEAIDGRPIRDPIDFRFHFGEEDLELTVRRREEVTVFQIEKDPDEDLGVSFEDMPILKCDNKCVFCFLHQMPKKLRKTLYYQDDDYRLSFLHGAYVTLTNLSDEEFDRIVKQRLTPMYVSVHATDPDVRGHLLGRKGPVDVLERIDFLIDAGIEVHTQVVLCPGINDGPHLEKTIQDLAERYPSVASLGVVPLGLTKFRQNLPDLAPIGPEDCTSALGTIHGFQESYLKSLGSRFVYAGDEFYLQHGEQPPDATRYDGFPLIENGIGMVRRFLDDFVSKVSSLSEKIPSGRITLVTGQLGRIFLEPMATKLNTRPGTDIQVLPVVNQFLGEGITVSGLLAGEDILRTLKGRDRLGDRIILPPNCVNHEGILLDDITPAVISEDMGVAVQVGTYSLIDTLCGDASASPRAQEKATDHPYIASHQNP
ncbi:TPA: hypothetical protein DCE37_02335 [Candidatus Latescibacteria bacterium]|nr:hypothetical protein [Candidatus Latescibacterota bacterium]